jgi:hypothetical protein
VVACVLFISVSLSVFLAGFFGGDLRASALNCIELAVEAVWASTR